MEQQYAPSASERPMSEGVASAGGNVPVAEGSVVGGAPRESRATNGMDLEHGPQGMAPLNQEMYDPGNAASNLFLFVTLGLAAIGWIVTLVSQADVAANINNDLVRILWFGLIIQTFVTVLVVEVVLGLIFVFDYAMQISILAALATGFAVIGVDRNIYSNASAQQATGAGWLIIAIVDLLWILYFTSPPHSLIVRAASSAQGPSLTRTKRISRISQSAGGVIPMGAVHGSHARMSQGPAVPVDQKPASGVWGSPENRRTIGSIPGSERDSKAGSAPAGSTTAKVSPEVHTPVQAGPPLVAQASSLPDESAIGRAEAIYDYTASEKDKNEVSFKKGDSLLIFDTSNKWWEAKTMSGNKGIAPSNYLRMVEEFRRQ